MRRGSQIAVRPGYDLIDTNAVFQLLNIQKTCFLAKLSHLGGNQKVAAEELNQAYASSQNLNGRKIRTWPKTSLNLQRTS